MGMLRIATDLLGSILSLQLLGTDYSTVNKYQLECLIMCENKRICF